MNSEEQMNYKREYEATHVMIQVPDEAWSCEEECQSCREGWTGVFSIVLDTGEYVWVNASYAHGQPKDVVQVGEARNNGYDREGNCVLSVPASWCKFYTPDEADAIEHCLEADRVLMSYAR